MEQKNYRIVGLDWIRVLATIMVILLHTSAITFIEYKSGWVIGALYDSFTRCAVPLFFLVSGFFLLNSDCGKIKSFILKRFTRILVPFLLTCVVYALYKNWTLIQLIEKSFLQGPLDYHLWFVYSIIGIYLIFPIINPIFKGEHSELITYYLCIWFISFIFYQTIQSCFSLSFNPFTTFNCYYFQGYLGYAVLGGWLGQIFKKSHHQEIRMNKLLSLVVSKQGSGLNYLSLFMYFLFSLVIFLCTYINTLYIGKPSELFFDYSNLFVFLQTITFFFAFVHVKNGGGVICISKYTYWIYLLHILCLGFVLKYVPILENSLLTIPLATIFTFLLAYTCSLPLFFLENEIIKRINKCFQKKSIFNLK